MALNIDITPILSEITSQSSAFSLEFSKLIYEKYIEARSIKELHDIQTGVKKGAKIPLASKGKNYNYMKSKQGLTSQCDFNECDVTVKFSTKTWDTHAYNCEVKLCKADLEHDFKKWWGMNECDSDTDTEDAFIKFLVDWVGDALIASHWVKAWFTTATYPTTSGLFGADALFVQMQGIAPANHKQRITIPENANADYATQLALNPQRGFEVYSEIHDRALKSQTLRGNMGSMHILTTEDLAINYLQYLRTNNQVNCCFKDDVTKGVYSLDNLNIYGMPIKIVREWDDIIQGTDLNGTPYFSELNNGTKYTDPHRAVLTYKENIPVGTCNEGNLDNVEVLYNPYDRNMSIRSEYEIGSQVVVNTDFILAE